MTFDPLSRCWDLQPRPSEGGDTSSAKVVIQTREIGNPCTSSGSVQASREDVMRCGQTPRFYHKKVPVTVRDPLEQVVSRHVLQELFQKEWLILP